MSDINESSPTRGSDSLGGRVVINQIDGSVSIYDANNMLINKIGDLGNGQYGIATYDDDGNVITETGAFSDSTYGTNIYDQNGVLVIKQGYLGLDGSSNPMYGTMLYDENGVPRRIDGKKVNGF